MIWTLQFYDHGKTLHFFGYKSAYIVSYFHKFELSHENDDSSGSAQHLFQFILFYMSIHGLYNWSALIILSLWWMGGRMRLPTKAPARQKLWHNVLFQTYT